MFGVAITTTDIDCPDRLDPSESLDSPFVTLAKFSYHRSIFVNGDDDITLKSV